MIAVFALISVQSSTHQAVTSWREYADQASVEQRALRAFVTQAGGAGLIDEYHTFAATGDVSRLPMIYGRGGAALAALSAYPVEDPDSAEARARDGLQARVRLMMARVSQIANMYRAGRSRSEIMAVANIDDAATNAALDTLADETRRSMLSNTSDGDSKSLVLLDLRRLVGLEGLAHHANRVFAGIGEDALSAARQSVSATELAIQRYERLGLSPDEATHLDHLKAAVNSARSQIEAGQNPSKPFFDSSALAAPLAELEKIIYANATTAQDNMQSTLEEVSSRAGNMMILVIVGAVCLIAGAIWLFIFHFARRINAITRAMRDLAQGKLDTEIPARADQDEIGEMSRALVVFRDGLRTNATLTAELAESSRLASLGAMVAGMAHELNTPIGNALAVSSTLEEQCKTFKTDINSGRLLRSTLERHAKNLEDGAALIQRNLLRAAEQIGSFKQVAVDQTSGKRRTFDLDDVLANVVHSLQPSFKRTPFVLSLGEPSGVTMESYPGALSQVVTNLVENGLKHGLMGRDQGRVTIHVRRRDADTTEISVADNGAGIPDEVAPSIFHAFFTTKAGAGGSGLGLHIVKSIVCGPLGGEISVESRPGDGARFVICLPNTAPVEASTVQTTERTYYATAQHAA